MPETPGVYIMKDTKGKILYIGKAINLKRRVSSYFTHPHDTRIQKLVSLIRTIKYKETQSALEALILESSLIKKHQPPYNIKEKDGKSFLYVGITREEFPRVMLVRGKEINPHLFKIMFGPFPSSSQLREALRMVRKIFPFSTHKQNERHTKPCFDYGIHLCPGTCVSAITKKEYTKTINHITLFFEGKKERILNNLTKEMSSVSKKLDFERAEKIKRQIFALQHIQDVALIKHEEEEGQIDNKSDKKLRIEGYDVSTISGTSAVGSMVVFLNGVPEKSAYRKFKIKTIETPNDVGMMHEMLMRRFTHKNNEKGWELPDCILVDGGRGQVNIAQKVLAYYKLTIPIVGIAKGAERKRNDILGKIPEGINKETLIRVRDEAHRFAIAYHREVRRKDFMI